jgi:SAM-dependent methyltransferase
MAHPKDQWPTANAPDPGPASNWVQRWSHLVPAHGTVLDIACGPGRHVKWFSERGHAVIGVDCSSEALHAAAHFGQTVLADIENDPWPLMNDGQPRKFDAVIVTHYLWRPLFPLMAQSVAPGGLLIYETFAQGNETVGKPSRADFLLRPAELLSAFSQLHLIAFEDGFLDSPPRFMQRIVAARPELASETAPTPARYRL